MRNHLCKAHKSELLFQGSQFIIFEEPECSTCWCVHIICSLLCSPWLHGCGEEKGLNLFWIQTAGVNEIKLEWKVSLLTFGKHLHYSYSKMVEHVCCSLCPVFLSCLLFSIIHFWYHHAALISGVSSCCVFNFNQIFFYFSHCCQSFKLKISSQLQRASVYLNP